MPRTPYTFKSFYFSVFSLLLLSFLILNLQFLYLKTDFCLFLLVYTDLSLLIFKFPPPPKMRRFFMKSSSGSTFITSSILTRFLVRVYTNVTNKRMKVPLKTPLTQTDKTLTVVIFVKTDIPMFNTVLSVLDRHQ